MLKIKNIVALSFLLVLLVSCEQGNSYKQAEFYVRGNCSMCEDRIEKSATDLKGVLRAEWNVQTKNLSITYDSTQVTELKIQQAIANSGHETKTVQSPTAAHDALPECCKKDGSM